MAEYVIRPVRRGDQRAVVEIFNHYALNSMAAFSEQTMDLSFFYRLRQMGRNLPFLALERQGQVVGFGLLRPYHPDPVFSRTAEVTMFILPQHTRQGQGSRMLEALSQEAAKMGVDNLVASISSHNLASLEFHRSQGFRPAGILQRVGRKHEQDFDVVTMQKPL